MDITLDAKGALHPQGVGAVLHARAGHEQLGSLLERWLSGDTFKASEVGDDAYGHGEAVADEKR